MCVDYTLRAYVGDIVQRVCACVCSFNLSVRFVSTPHARRKSKQPLFIVSHSPHSVQQRRQTEGHSMLFYRIPCARLHYRLRLVVVMVMTLRYG